MELPKNLNIYRLDHKKVTIAILSVLFIALLSVFIIRPSIIGYSVFQQTQKLNSTVVDYSKSLDQLKTEISITNVNLSSCNSVNKKLFDEFKLSTDGFASQLQQSAATLAICNGDLAALNSNFSATTTKYSQDLANLQSQLRNQSQQMADLYVAGQNATNVLTDNYNQLAVSSARSICCKAKVDNQAINSYSTDNNKITCSDSASIPLTC